MLRRMAVTDCPELETLEGVPVLKSLLLNDKPWEIVGTSAYQAGQQRQLPQNLTIFR